MTFTDDFPDGIENCKNMAAAFHYAVKIKLFNYHSKDKVEYIEHFEEFRNDNPINARIAAFRCYQNWVDILLDGIDKMYSTDKQSREDLKAYLTPNIGLSITFGQNEIDLSNSLSVGIGVYLIIDIPAPAIYKDDNLNDHAGDEDLIHGIGNSSEFNDPSSFAFYLENEFEYYCNNEYDYRGYKTEATCYNWRTQSADDFEFLETPFDWSGLDNPNNPALLLVTTKDYSDIIANGEGETVEFKPTLSYHFTNRTWEGKHEVNYKISKAISAFLNSKGGLLFIGVKDNGEVQGLDFDFKLTDKENKKDYFKLDFDRLIEKFLGFSVKALVNSDFADIEGKTIFVVEVKPSITRPVFLKAQENKKEFWVRGNASNRQLTDIEEIINYWLDRQQS